MTHIKIKLGKSVFNIKDCRGLGSLRGLMFDNMDGHDGALITGSSIWMPFVKSNLNLIFLDKGMKILDKQLAVPLTLNPKTWKVYSNGKAKYCLELKHTKLSVKKGAKIVLNS